MAHINVHDAVETVITMSRNMHSALKGGELPADDLARLTDRVLLAAGKPQRFGTQFDWYAGQFTPKGAGNIADIEANRQALGLMPLADYACMMNGRLRRD